ncbi:MAG: DUF6432 family protein [Halodesulfurarchaeum sp.]
MKLRREYRNRGETQVAILEALADRHEEGMTVFELRSRVGVEIGELEDALAKLQEDELISASEERNRTLLTVDDRILEEETTGDGETDVFDQIIDRLGL